MTYSYKYFCSLMVCLAISYSSFAATIFVNADAISGGNNGQSWTNAFTNLTDALAVATAADQIWVASGSYFPTEDGNQSISFVIPSGVEILGGFPNTGNPTLANRNPQTNVTTLNGDIDHDGSLANNSYTVIYTKDVDASTIVDGFTITGGNADGGVSTNFPVLLENGGAAWYNEGSNFVNSNPTIRNCLFTNNHASNRGGAIFSKAPFGANADYTIENSIFRSNSAAREGGAIFNAQSGTDSHSNPSISNTLFQNNEAGMSGGAIYNNGAFFGEVSGTYTDCDFITNKAIANEGAAVYNNAFFQGTSSPIFTNCDFIANDANPGSGGAIYTDASSGGTANFKVINCLFENNSSDVYGGAICNIITSGGEIKPTYANCTFTRNTSVNGGATYSRAAFGGEIDVLVVNCVFYQNTGEIGGTIYQNSNGDPAIVTTQVSNSIFQENTAVSFSPTFHLTGFSTIDVNNSLFDVANCLELVEGETNNEAVCGGGNIYNQNPQFVNPAMGDFHLSATSPAIGAGNNADVPSYLTEDADGNPRISGGTVDLGIFEQVDTNTDSDLDGIPDFMDNCPVVQNPNQADIDGDGAGTVCDCDDTVATGISCSTGCSTFYADADGDGFGNPATGVTTCVAPTGYVSNNSDFDDTDNTLFPNAPELCDGKDNNNNGQIDEGTDDDNDGVCNEDDICEGGDDNLDVNANGVPDDCESQINLNCPADITISANAGQNTAIVSWNEPTGTTDCDSGDAGDQGADCTGAAIDGFSYMGSFGNSDYYLSSTSATWTTAAAISESHGGHLVVINSQAENDFVRNFIATAGEIILIGLTDVDTEGDYQWINGDAFTFNNLQANPGEEDYGIMYFWDGTWVMSGDFSKVYVIERPCGGASGSGGLTISQSTGPTNGAAFPIGPTPVSYTAQDACGGLTTCSFNVTVEAGTSIVNLTCPNDISVNADPGANSAVVTYQTPIGNTTCATGDVSLSLLNGLSSGASFPTGTTIIEYEGMDQCGSTAVCSFSVTVNATSSDISINCPADITATIANATETVAIIWDDPTGTSSCSSGGYSFTQTGPASGSLFGAGSTIITYTASDNCGSSISCSFNVTVNIDNSSISLVCPQNINRSIPEGSGGTTVTCCLLYTSPSPRDATLSRMPSSA